MTPKQREKCIVFLDDNLDSLSSFETLKNAGFEVRRFTEYFPREDNPTKRAANVKDSKIIALCHRLRFLLLTADKEMKTTFWEELSATTIGVVATANNNDGDDIWVEVFKKFKAKIERGHKKNERPYFSVISKAGEITTEVITPNKGIRRIRPREKDLE